MEAPWRSLFFSFSFLFFLYFRLKNQSELKILIQLVFNVEFVLVLLRSIVDETIGQNQDRDSDRKTDHKKWTVLPQKLDRSPTKTGPKARRPQKVDHVVQYLWENESTQATPPEMTEGKYSELEYSNKSEYIRTVPRKFGIYVDGTHD